MERKMFDVMRTIILLPVLLTYVLAQDDLTTLPPWVSTEPPPSLDVRLPTSLVPHHYIVKLQPFVHGNFSIRGYVEVELEVVEDTNNVTLHIEDLVTWNDTVKVLPIGGSGPHVSIVRHQYYPRHHFYIAHLDTYLPRGSKYLVSMEYEALLNDKLHGFYRSTYRDDTGNERLLAVTQLQPTYARRVFPCMDEPALKATFEVFLARQTNMSSVSNMPLVKTTPVAGQEGWVWDHFERSVPMSTYLVAFMVSDLQHKTSPDTQVQFRVWSRASATNQSQYSLDIGPRILHFLEQYFDVPYPLPKQDMVGLPDFSAGAMENWGLITYRENYVLFDRSSSSPRNKQSVAYIVAHELAHQWFGNLVTPRWWNDLWLNEGFATIVGYIAMDHVEPTWNGMELFAVEKLQTVFGLDSLTTSHPISVPVNNPDEISEIFDGISYSKGASIIRMMMHFLGENTFRRGVTNYLNAFQYSSATQDDLWHHLTLAGHEDLTLPPHLTAKTIMDSWTLKMGYPVLKVTRDHAGTTAQVTQERFLLVPEKNATEAPYRWWVPVSYTSQHEANFNNTRPQLWLADTQASTTVTGLPPSDQWVVFNVQQTGFYRVNYDEATWALLVRQLKTDHTAIHPANRAQLIDDAMNLAKAGQLRYDIALSLYDYLSQETEYSVWSAATRNLAYVNTVLKRTRGYGALKRYILNLIEPLYRRLGFEDRLDDPQLVRYSRRTAVSWSCQLGSTECQQRALTLYREWMADADNDTLISANLKYAVYCHGIEAGGEVEWDFAWSQYLKANAAAEKSTLLKAMGCTKELWLLQRYLEMAFQPSSGIRTQDSSLVFNVVARNDLGGPLAMNYLRDNWNKMFEHKKRRRSGALHAVTEDFHTRSELKELRAFIHDSSTDLEGNRLGVSQVEEKVSSNVAWVQQNQQAITDFLLNRGFSTTLRVKP